MSDPRPSPWHHAADDLKVWRPIDPSSSLIANLTPKCDKVRLGVMINGRESSVAVSLEQAEEFFDEVVTLIRRKGVSDAQR